MAGKAMGTLIKIGLNAIAELTSIGGLELSADTIETTTYESVGAFRTFMAGLKDAGEVPLSGFLNPSDENGQMALLDALINGTELDLSIIFPAAIGAQWNFKGLVTKFATTEEMEDGIGFEATIKVSGKPTLPTSASTGLSALVLTGTGGSLSPSFANGTYYYTFDGVTASAVNVTATAASHTLKLYVDGVFTETLTSGAASEDIAMAAAGSKKLTIVASEAGKASVVYEIVIVKTS